MDNQSAQIQINPVLRQFFEVMKSDGVKIEEMLLVSEQIDKIVAGRFYTEVMLVLDKEEVKIVNEQAKTQEEADQMIEEFFKRRTGEDPWEIKEKILTDVTQQYLDDYMKQRAAV